MTLRVPANTDVSTPSRGGRTAWRSSRTTSFRSVPHPHCASGAVARETGDARANLFTEDCTTSSTGTARSRSRGARGLPVMASFRCTRCDWRQSKPGRVVTSCRTTRYIRRRRADRLADITPSTPRRQPSWKRTHARGREVRGEEYRAVGSTRPEEGARLDSEHRWAPADPVARGCVRRVGATERPPIAGSAAQRREHRRCERQPNYARADSARVGEALARRVMIRKPRCRTPD